MLGRLFSYEKHIQMVSDVYQNNTANEEKLSKLITYLKSRTSNIPNVLDYLKVRAREEVYSSHQLKVTSRIVRSIIDQLRGVSICYESRTIKVFIGVVKEVLRLKRIGSFEYSDHQEFLDVFVYFFETVPIRTHKSEKYIRRILFVATGVTRTIVNPDRNKLNILSDDGLEHGRNVSADEAAESDDESSSIVDFHGCEVSDLSEMSDARFDYFFLEIIHTLVRVEDVLGTDCDEKYGWLVNSLVRPGEVNSHKRKEIFRLVVQRANIISGHSLIYYVLKYGSQMGKSSVDVLLEQLQPNLYPQVILQTNINILEKGGCLSSTGVDGGSGDMDASERYKAEECMILAKDATDILNRYDISHLNQREITLSFFNIMRMFFSREPCAADRFCFIMTYVREYFEKCRFISDVFYGFLRRLVQDPGCVKYTERLRCTVFEEIQRYFIIHSVHISDPRFIILLLNSSTDVFEEFCCKILYMVKDYFITRTLKPSMREGIMGKVRSLFHRTGNRDLFHLLVELMRHEIPLKDQYKILCLINDKGLLDARLIQELYCGGYKGLEELLADRFNKPVIDGYTPEDDERVYETYVLNTGTSRPRHPGSREKSRRHSRIMLVDYDL